MVDAIIDAALATTSREDEVVALTALDRALRYERVITHAGYVPETWVAYFDMFERPEELPPYAVGVLDFWWYNKEKPRGSDRLGCAKEVSFGRLYPP